MQQYRILWADDEIDLLKPHILFLQKKGYEVTPVNSGSDALEQIDHHTYDIVFLDENMPGLSGLETLNYIKSTHPNLPVIMITKNEEEEIMEEAIGAKIADYLIKPLNPNQILLSIKKILDNKRIISEKTNQGYQKDFQQLSSMVMDANSHKDWIDIYKKLVYWEMLINESDDKSMVEVLHAQKAEADKDFSDFVVENYESWIQYPEMDKPMLSHEVLKRKVFNQLGEDPVFLFVIDNLRYDQWKMIEPEVAELFKFEDKSLYYSILPTTTAYARNSLFGGLMPNELAKRYSEFWEGEASDDGKNNYEADFLEANMARQKVDVDWSYHKILRIEEGKQLANNIHNLMNNSLNAIVFNFVDMLSHARTDMQMIKELAPDESAYRSLTKTWFSHSSLFEILKYLSETNAKVMITTDHGTIQVNKPYKIVGDRNTNTNLRYKVGKNLDFNEKNVYFNRNPESIGLPKTNLTSTYVFAKDDYFFAYPNNYNYYAKHFKESFQHGGISMEEIMIPFITLSSK